MSETMTEERVLDAARGLEQKEFTRADLATKLEVDREQLKPGFKAARQSGSLEKVRNDEDGTGVFTLAS